MSFSKVMSASLVAVQLQLAAGIFGGKNIDFLLIRDESTEVSKDNATESKALQRGMEKSSWPDRAFTNWFE